MRWRERRPSFIAIDGPGGAGKSAIGSLLAQRLGYRFLDTGVMYRAVTWRALQLDMGLENEEALARLAESTKVTVGPPSVADGRLYSVFVEGQDVTWEIRRPEVDANVSAASKIPGVRRALVAQQRAWAQGGRIVMAGRDIGTVVLPQADLKIFLGASPEERARRRHQEMLDRGEPADYQEILSEMRRRDRIDSQRADSPLRPAEDAIIIDTDDLGIPEVLRKIEAWWGEG